LGEDRIMRLYVAFRILRRTFKMAVKILFVCHGNIYNISGNPHGMGLYGNSIEKLLLFYYSTTIYSG